VHAESKTSGTPGRLCSITVKPQTYGKKIIGHGTRVSFSFVNFVRNNFRSDKYLVSWVRDKGKHTQTHLSVVLSDFSLNWEDFMGWVKALNVIIIIIIMSSLQLVVSFGQVSLSRFQCHEANVR
jgi:hypothetical protein